MSRQWGRERVILLFKKEGPALVNSVVAVTKYPNTSNLGKKGLILTQQFKGVVHHEQERHLSRSWRKLATLHPHQEAKGYIQQLDLNCLFPFHSVSDSSPCNPVVHR